MIIIGKLFFFYKIFYRKLFKIIFVLIKKLIININGNNIEEILKSETWQNARSVLFFYTNILIEPHRKINKDYPVKRFKVKWYIWLMHYLWAVWLFFKIAVYIAIYYSFRSLKYDLWKFLWLVLLEYWRHRLLIANWTLQIIWVLIFIYVVTLRIGVIIYQDHYLWLGIFLRFLRINKFFLFIKVHWHKFLRFGDKIFRWLNF